VQSSLKLTILAAALVMKLIKMNSDINRFNLTSVDLNLLKVFLVLCQEHNVTRAADRLCVSQSAVSSSLKRLRHLYKDPLFERTQAGMKPTSRALLLRPLVQEALAKVELSLSEALEPDFKLQTRTITIGLSDDYEIAFARKIVQKVHQDAPNFRIIFRQTNSEKVVQALKDHKIDLAITGGGINDSRIKHQTLGQAGYLCVFDKRLRSKKTAMLIDEYLEREHILISYSGITGAVDDGLEEQGMTRKVRVASTHFSALPFLLSDTEAVATIPEFAAREIAKDSRFGISICPLAIPGFAVDIGWHYDAIRDPALVFVRDLTADIIVEALVAV